MDTTIDPRCLTFNRRTLETKVWARHTDDPQWSPDVDKPLKTYTSRSIPRYLFDTLPCAAQVLIVQDLQRRGIGWHKEQGSWRKYRIAADRSHAHVNLPARPMTRARGAGRPKAHATRSSARSGDSGSSDPDEEPPRVCRNGKCGADISHLHALAEYCDNGGACKQSAYRDRLTHKHLEELVGTVAAAGVSCTCSPMRHVVIGGVCHHCGKPRGAVTRGWLDDTVAA